MSTCSHLEPFYRCAIAVDAAEANKRALLLRLMRFDWDAIAKTRRSVREYLDTLDGAAWGAASVTVPKFISKSDAAAQGTGAHKGLAVFAYANNPTTTSSDLKASVRHRCRATRAIRQATSYQAVIQGVLILRLTISRKYGMLKSRISR